MTYVERELERVQRESCRRTGTRYPLLSRQNTYDGSHAVAFPVGFSIDYGEFRTVNASELAADPAHISRADDEDLAPVLDAKGSVAIVDEMFSRVLRNGDEREHLVVELKRPSVAIDGAVATQIERYAQDLKQTYAKYLPAASLEEK